MDIVHEEHQSGGVYRINLPAGSAEMTYSRSSTKLIIVDHTGVDDRLRGQGIGQALAEYAIAEARKGGWKIIPLCPFMRAQAQRHPDWQDVIQI
ncbi:GNAT family N-acetyltransferase [Rhizobium helianthi]|uniref:GNAT family N-acetyltransferase n=1 Tax=Rhizobium helianthi TaxID=1132695 RepID=A0ABW4M2P1_9HYPH